LVDPFDLDKLFARTPTAHDHHARRGDAQALG
jgi:hypothetical protein